MKRQRTIWAKARERTANISVALRYVFLKLKYLRVELCKKLE